MDEEPKTLFMCYMCHMIRDESSSSWIAKRIYREWTGIDPTTCQLTRMYCPTCHAFCLGDAA
jgi:hypothetical protein